MDRIAETSPADLSRGYAAHLARVYGEAAVNACENCGTTHGSIEEVWTDDGRKPLLCEECAEEVRHLEAQANALAAQAGCAEREAVANSCESTEQLVNTLRAHDMAQCAACASTRGTVTADRLYVDPAAVCCEGKAA